MSFVNAYLTEEEKEKFKEAKIKDPRYKISKKDFLIPGNWTVDRENNISLIYCGVADREEHDKETFALIYKKLDNEHLIELILTNVSIRLEERRRLEEIYNVDFIEKWDVINYEIPKNLGLEIANKELYNIIKDALSVYGIKGDPRDTGSVKAILDVKGVEV